MTAARRATLGEIAPMNFRRALLSAAALTLVVAPAAFAGKPSAGSTTSTVNGFHTWNSDMVNMENITQDGDGVYVAVLDTGLVSNWSDYFPKARIAADLGTGFYQKVEFSSSPDDPCRVEGEEVGALRQTTFVGSISSSHGSHVTSTIIGYNYKSNTDAAQGYSLPAIQVRGIAPDVTIIPVKVLADYQLPKMPQCDDPDVAQGLKVNFGTDSMIAAGINYVTALAEGQLAGSRVVISMSLGGDELSEAEQQALDDAIAAGVIVVAAAGNEGTEGMHFPGAYAPVISAGCVGWVDEWTDHPGDAAAGNEPVEPANRYRMFWLKNWFGDDAGQADSLVPPLYADSGDVPDPTSIEDIYVCDFSSRSLNEDQDLDVLAPGSWVRGPFGGDPGFNHLPWWAKGLGDIFGLNSGNFFYVGGTSMSTPHVSSAAALLLEKDDTLQQADIETILESTALPLPAGSRQIWDFFDDDADNAGVPDWDTISWGSDAVGSGVLQLDAALNSAP